MKKKKNIIYLCILITVLIFAYLYNLIINDNIVDKNHFFEYVEIKNNKNNCNYSYDIDEYKNNIINDKVLSIDYTFFHNDESIIGKIYIGNDKNLYITDSNKNKKYKISNEKFSTMYINNYKYVDKVFVFLISENNDVYNIQLYDNDISKTKLYKYNYNEKFTNFVDIDFNNDIYDLGIPVFALTENNKIIDINSGLQYDEKIIALYNSIYLYPDKTMTNLYGLLLESREKKPYKLKYIFDVHNNDFIDAETPIIIVTEDDKFIYLNEDNTKVYEFDKKVKDIKYDQYYPYVDGKLEIIFEDDYKVEFTARCNEYYCINKFAE